MLLKNELRKIIAKQQGHLERDLGVVREMEVSLIPEFATIISGIRRCGKSTLARQLLKDKKPIYFLHFEDINLVNFELDDFSRLENAFREELGQYGSYLFDEIQIIEGWEKYIRQLADRGEEVIITGSNASMLSKELGTRLTGRQLTKELYPFSFKEFLKITDHDANESSFREYLEMGGFPEFLKYKDKEIIRNLFNDIIYRDILQRHEIRNETGIKSLLHYLLGNIGNPVSYSKLKDLIKAGSTNTISQYMDYFEEAYLLFALKKYDYSIRKQIVNPKKIYCVDNAIIGEIAFSFSENRGRLLENSVFVEFKRRGEEIFYHSARKECDFIIKKRQKISKAVQVCWEINEDNKKREVDGLLEAINTYNLKSGLILTFNQEDRLVIDRREIDIMPVRRWMVE